jgi:hypothetical protein
MDIDYLVPTDLPGDRYLADAWLVAGLRRMAQYLIPENTEGYAARLGREATKERGRDGASFSERGKASY